METEAIGCGVDGDGVDGDGVDGDGVDGDGDGDGDGNGVVISGGGDGGAPAGGKPPLNKINFCVIPAGPRRPPTKKNIPTTTMGCLYVELAFTPLQTPSFANSCRVGDWAVH